VKNCYFIGDIIVTGTVSHVGGIIGYRRESSTILQNSYVAATISHADGTTYAITDGAENCYYDSTLNSIYTGGAGTAKTTAEMKTSEMKDLLNDGSSVWEYDPKVNAGYPYLADVKPDFVANKVEFDVGGHGTAPLDQEVISGWKAVKPDDLVEKGYIFGGWYKEVAFENKWDFDIDLVNGDTTLYAKWSIAPLTGTVTITGAFKYGELLTGTVTEDNNTGTLNYQWKRDDAAIEGADSATYVLTAEDIGKTLTLTVSSTEQPGSIVSEATDVVAKADSPDAPAGFTGIKPTNVAKDDGKIIGTSTDMEYSTSYSFADAAKVFGCTSEETVVPAPGTYYVRVKETATTKAGKAATVVVPDNTVYTVTVTAGANMAKTADSGEAAQSVVEETAITAIVYTAVDGYYFPEDYASLGMKNGITVEWMDAGSIRISGTPTATVALTLVAATQKPNRDGLVASFVMEADSNGANGAAEFVTYNETAQRYETAYTGAKIQPAVSVTNDGEPLTEGIDYTIKYSNNQKVSTSSKHAVVTIAGKGNYSGSKTLEFYIVPKSLADESGAAAEGITVGGLVIAKGSKAAPVVLYNGVKLGTKDYTVTQNGEESVDITGQNNFTGTIKGLKLTVLADSAALKQASIKVAVAKGVSRTYTGLPQMLTVATKAKEGELTVTSADGTVLTEGTDFEVSYGANVNAGTVKVTVTGIGAYTGSMAKTFKILPAKDAKITAKLIAEPGSAAGKYSFVKTGVMPKLAVTAVVTGVSETGSTKTVTNSLTEGVDYKVTYKNNKAVSTDKAKASYVVTFLGNYKGAKLDNTDTTFTITEASLKDAQVLVGDMLYNAKSAKYGKYFQKPSVVLNGALLAKNEYAVAYYDDKNNELKASDALNLSAENPTQVIRVKISASAKSKNYKDAGSLNPTATYTVRFDANAGQAGAKIDISKAKITLADASGKKVSKVSYTGKEITFDPADETDGHKNQAILTVTIGNPKKGGVVLKGQEVYDHFDVAYANNVAKGKATIILTPKAEEATYIGTRTGTFTIAAANVKTDMRVKDATGALKGIFGK